MNGLDIIRVVYGEPYRSDEAPVREALLKGAGIRIEQLEETVGGNKKS
jgi:deoxycytidylate deaminase